MAPPKHLLALTIAALAFSGTASAPLSLTATNGAIVDGQTAGVGLAELKTDDADAAGSLKLDAILGSGMVLPADDAQLWGTAAPKVALTVTVTAAAGSPKQFKCVAGEHGTWQVNVSMLASLDLHNITVTSGADTATLADVMFGAVLICVSTPSHQHL